MATAFENLSALYADRRVIDVWLLATSFSVEASRTNGTARIDQGTNAP
jgi:hypothetical protein